MCADSIDVFPPIPPVRWQEESSVAAGRLQICGCMRACNSPGSCAASSERCCWTAASHNICDACNGVHRGLTATSVSAGGRRGPAKPQAPAQPRAGAGPQPSRKLRTFFWDVLPDSRIRGTFWEAHPPPYASLDTAEVLQPPSRAPPNVASRGLPCTADPWQIELSAQTVKPLPQALSALLKGLKCC